MIFPTITVQDPRSVQKWAASQIQSGTVRASYTGDYEPWQIVNIDSSRTALNSCLVGVGHTPEEALEDLKAKVAEHDPLSEARRLAEAHGFTLTPATP